MFEAKKAMLMYCTSPVHAGAGQAFGLIDNPIQRERHTGHPLIAGSGVKGATRHHLWRKWGDAGNSEETSRELLNRIFGPEPGKSSDYAGAISFTDAQLVVFPIRSVKHGFVYATSPLALARAARLLGVCNHAVTWKIPGVDDGQAVVINDKLISNTSLLLEAQAFQRSTDSTGFEAIAEDLAKLVIPEGGYFHDKLKTDLVLLSDSDFSWFVNNATVIEAHISINPETGVTTEGSLHYSENLPPESVLISAVMATQERSREEDSLQADRVLTHVVAALHQSLLQIGGDATTGRGQVSLHFAGGSHA